VLGAYWLDVARSKATRGHAFINDELRPFSLELKSVALWQVQEAKDFF
jgi:hypothetical protein